MIKRTTDPNEIDFRAKFDLSKKWIVVTGACGLIGRVFCEAIAQFGGNVIVTRTTKIFSKMVKAHHLEKTMSLEQVNVSTWVLVLLGLILKERI